MRFDLISIGCLSLDTLLEIPFLPKINSECFINQVKNIHGGAAANVAAYATFYGDLKVGLVSRIGADKIGAELLARMRLYRVDTKGVKKMKNHSSTRIITLQFPNSTRSYLVHLGALESLSSKDIPTGYLQNSILYYVAPSTPQSHNEFLEIAVSYGKLVAFNPGTVYFQQARQSQLRRLLKYVDFLFVNEREALYYTNENTIDASGIALQKMGAKYVIITLGYSGCHVFYQGIKNSFLGYKTNCESSIGAGDAFAAGFLAKFLKTRNIQSAAKMGNIFGAFGVTHSELRNSTPNRKKFLAFSKSVRRDIHS